MARKEKTRSSLEVQTVTGPKKRLWDIADIVELIEDWEANNVGSTHPPINGV
jgi:hypothetical protein